MQTWGAEEPHVWSTQELGNTLLGGQKLESRPAETFRIFMLRMRVFGDTDLTQNSEKSDVRSGPKPREVTRKGGHGFSNTEISLSAERLDTTHVPSTLGLLHFHRSSWEKEAEHLRARGSVTESGQRDAEAGHGHWLIYRVCRRCWTQRGRGTRT